MTMREIALSQPRFWEAKEVIEKAIGLARRVPIKGASAPTTFGRWLDSLPLEVVLFEGGPFDFSRAEGNTLYLRANDLVKPLWNKVYDTNSVGLANVTAWLLHEARHTDAGGGKRHTTGLYRNALTMDGSVQDGGAWMIEHLFYASLARQPWLSPMERSFAEHDAVSVLRNVADGHPEPNPSAVAKIPHLSAEFCYVFGHYPFCGDTSPE